MPQTDDAGRRYSGSTSLPSRLVTGILLVGVVLYGYGVLARLNFLGAVPRGSLFGGVLTGVAAAVGALYLATGVVVGAWCRRADGVAVSTARTVVLAAVATLLAVGLLGLLFRGQLGWAVAGIAVLGAQLAVGNATAATRQGALVLLAEAIAVGAVAIAVMYATRDVVPAASAAVVGGFAAVALLVGGGPLSRLGARLA